MARPFPDRHYLMRLRRGGPIVPARLRWLDHEPGEPDNVLDRGAVSLYPAADIAGEEADPDIILDRIGVQRRHGDAVQRADVVLAALAHPASLTPRPALHWAYAQPVDEATYRYHFDRLRWAERNAPADPVLAPRTRVDPEQLPLPDFSRERSLVDP